MRVAAIQMTSVPDLDRNLGRADQLIARAVRAGAALVALPEMFPYMREEGLPNPAAQAASGEIVGFLAERAKAHEIVIVGGSFPERCEGDATRVYNTCPVLDSDGTLVACYRKIHLFDVDLDAPGGRLQESATIAPGDTPVVADTRCGRLGLSICYDLRFPELYRMLASRGAKVLFVPSAFTETTGRDHWEVLLRARAIENQCFVIAPAQFGAHHERRRSYGRSMIIDPWGIVLACAPDGEGMATADLDFEAQERVRARLPALRHRRLADPSPG